MENLKQNETINEDANSVENNTQILDNSSNNSNYLRQKALAMLKFKHKRPEDNIEEEKELKKRGVEFPEEIIINNNNKIDDSPSHNTVAINNDTKGEDKLNVIIEKSENDKHANVEDHNLILNRIEDNNTINVEREKYIDENLMKANIIDQENHSGMIVENSDNTKEKIITTNCSGIDESQKLKKTDQINDSSENRILQAIPITSNQYQTTEEKESIDNNINLIKPSVPDVPMLPTFMTSGVTNKNSDNSEIPKAGNEKPKDEFQKPKDEFQKPKEEIQKSKDEFQKPKEEIQKSKEDDPKPKEEIIKSKEENLKPKDEVSKPKKITFTEAKKEIEEFSQEIDKIEKNIKEKYGVNLTEFYMEDLIPEELKIKLVEDFFNSEEIVELSRKLANN